MIRIKDFLQRHIEDILIFSGWAIMLTTTFFINKILGFYLLGLSFIVLALFLIKFPRR